MFYFISIILIITLYFARDIRSVAQVYIVKNIMLLVAYLNVYNNLKQNNCNLAIYDIEGKFNI